MRRLLHIARRTLELAGHSSGLSGGVALRFLDAGQAASLLRRYAGDPANLIALRAFLYREGLAASVHRLDDAAVIALVARALATDRAAAFEIAAAPLRSFFSEGEPVPDGPVPDAAQAQKTWIEIELVDLEGQPVKGARYWIKLVDASIVEGCLDDHGRARVDDIDPGTCEIRWPDHDEEAVKLATVALSPPKPVLEDAPPDSGAPAPAALDGPAQALALQEAARNGVPFCEECEKAKRQRAAAAAR